MAGRNTPVSPLWLSVTLVTLWDSCPELTTSLVSCPRCSQPKFLDLELLVQRYPCGGNRRIISPRPPKHSLTGLLVTAACPCLLRCPCHRQHVCAQLTALLPGTDMAPHRRTCPSVCHGSMGPIWVVPLHSSACCSRQNAPGERNEHRNLGRGQINDLLRGDQEFQATQRLEELWLLCTGTGSQFLCWWLSWEKV